MGEAAPADELRQAAATLCATAAEAAAIGWEGYDLGGSPVVIPGDRPWIALMHPALGPLLAALLRAVADGWPLGPYVPTTQAAHMRKQALAFARQINAKREGK